MDTSNFWWQSAGDGPGPGPDPGDFIGQSLRFRSTSQSAGPYLHRTGFSNSGDVWTYSCWMKGWGPADTTAQYNAVIFSWHNNTGLDTVDELAIFGNYPSTGRNEINFYFQGASAGLSYSNDEFNDPSAWYHVVWQSASTSDVKLFINGRQITNWRTTDGVTAQSFINKNQTCSIGGRAPANTSPQTLEYHGEGYLSQVYFVDGTAAAPTDFARTNDNGVWVPVDYTGTYGTNGFHLTFDPTQDPDPAVAIGMDSSPNGNHFTSTGFNTDPVGIYSNMMTTDGTTINNPANMWTAGDAVGTDTAPNGSGLTIDFDTPINVQSTVWVHVGANNMEARLNGGAWTAIAPSTPGTPLAFNGELNQIELRITTANKLQVRKIVIDGTQLVNNTGTDYDLMQDSPTQNYSTMNPLLRYTNFNLQDANLVCAYPNGALNQERGFNTMQLGEQNAYYEITPTLLSEGMLFGIATQAAFSALVNSSSNSFIVNNGGSIQHNGVATGNTGPSFGVGDTVGFKWEGSTGTFSYTVDGSAYTTISTTPGEYFVMARIGNNSRAALNFGQQPFIHTPPAGFEALQTQNLPEATISNARDHFQAITGPGQGADLNDPGAGNWSNFLTVPGGWGSTRPPSRAFDGNDGTSTVAALTGDTVVTFAPDVDIPFTSKIDVRVGTDGIVASFADNPAVSTPNGSPTTIYSGAGTINADNPIRFTYSGSLSPHITAIFVDDVRLVDLSILNIAQNTYPQGLWWIKDRVNTNQHQLVDSVRNAETGTTQALFCPNPKTVADYIAPAGNSVAWCWSAPEAFTSNAGTIASSGQRNVDAGFSIVRWQAPGFDGTTRTVGHGLDKDPDFIIGKNFSVSGDNSHNFAVFVRGGTPNGQELFLEVNDGLFSSSYYPTPPLNGVITIQDTFIVDAGHNVVAYCWHSVPGYSAFGSYQGNGDASGPMIWTGFRPAFVMYKNIDTTGNWVIHDTTRNIANPTDIRLAANTDNSEGLSTSMQVDILSNGFKLKSNDPDLNANNRYAYCCFAENPFGGNNVSPANAR